jgi:5-methyltetrahydrofolate--homocysteine methyltransferase
MSIHIRFSDRDWERIERDWNAWWAGGLDRALVVLEVTEPDPAHDWSHLTKYGLGAPVDQILDNWQRILEVTHWLGDAYPKWWVNYGAGTMAAFLGSKPAWTPDTTWFQPLEGLESLADIHLVYDAGNPWWLRVQEVTRRAVERWGRDVLVGTNDIGGNLDILASLRSTEKLLFDLTDAPEEVDRLIGEITALWLRYYDELYIITSSVGRGNACWGPVWSPGKGYMLQSDFCYMISPRMFGRFVMPDLATCCRHLDYAFYHMDGKGQLPHLDQLLSLARLRGIQWQPGDGQPMADQRLPVLKRIRHGGKLCQVFVTAQGALTIQRELGGKGFLLHIQDGSLNLERGKAFLESFFAQSDVN